MRYLFAILLPPLGMLSAGRMIQAVLCLVLMVTLIGWPVASVWALVVVMDAKADRRAKQITSAVGRR